MFVGLLVKRESTGPWRERVNDSLIDDEASWLKYVEELDKTESTWLIISAVALVATFESNVDCEMVWVIFGMVFSDAGKDENKNWVSNLVNNLENSAVLNLHYALVVNSHSACHILAR